MNNSQLISRKHKLENMYDSLKDEAILIFATVQNILTKAKSTIDQISAIHDSKTFITEYSNAVRFLNFCNEILMHINLTLEFDDNVSSKLPSLTNNLSNGNQSKISNLDISSQILSFINTESQSTPCERYQEKLTVASPVKNNATIVEQPITVPITDTKLITSTNIGECMDVKATINLPFKMTVSEHSQTYETHRMTPESNEDADEKKNELSTNKTANAMPVQFHFEEIPTSVLKSNLIKRRKDSSECVNNPSKILTEYKKLEKASCFKKPLKEPFVSCADRSNQKPATCSSRKRRTLQHTTPVQYVGSATSSEIHSIQSEPVQKSHNRSTRRVTQRTLNSYKSMNTTEKVEDYLKSMTMGPRKHTPHVSTQHLMLMAGAPKFKKVSRQQEQLPTEDSVDSDTVSMSQDDPLETFSNERFRIVKKDDQTTNSTEIEKVNEDVKNVVTKTDNEDQINTQNSLEIVQIEENSAGNTDAVPKSFNKVLNVWDVDTFSSENESENILEMKSQTNCDSLIISNETLEMATKSEEINSKINEYSSLDFEAKDVPQLEDYCIVNHVESPSHFYIHVVDDETIKINTLHEELHDYCQSDTALKFSSKQEALKYNKNGCYACRYNHDYHNDYVWFRCRVIKWLPDNEDTDKQKVDVFLVDLGANLTVEISGLRFLPATFFEYKMFAVKCHLLHCYPPGSTEDNILSEWPTNVIAYFKNFVNLSDKAPLKISVAELQGDSIAVDLQNDSGMTLVLTLASTNLANLIIPMEETALIDGVLIKNYSMIEQIKQATGSNEEWTLDDVLKFEGMTESERITEIMDSGYLPMDDVRICKFYNPESGMCYKGHRCNFEHKPKRPDGITEDRELVFQSTVYSAMLPPEGTDLELTVSHLESIDVFYGHIRKSNSIKVLDSKKQVITSVKKLAKFLNSPESVKSLKTLKRLPAIGQLVLAQYDYDNMFYRARVIECGDENDIEVFFIDYGNKSKVKFSELRQIEREHIIHPPLAVRCKIANINRNKCEFNEKMLSLLAEIGPDEKIDAKVVSLSEDTMWILVKNDIGEDIGQKFIDNGMASPNNFILTSKIKFIPAD